MAKVFTTDNFETEVLNAEKPVLVDFWGNLVRTVQTSGSGCGRTGRSRIRSRESRRR